MNSLKLSCALLLLAATGFPSPLTAATPKRPSPALDLARQLNQAFIEVADNVSPSVVVIRVAQKPGRVTEEESNPFFDMMPPELRRFFEDRQDRRKQAPRREREPQSPPEPQFNGQGSGILIREDGYILTNRHVVDEAERIKVRLKDGTEFDATITGVDAQSDLAVIKIDPKGRKLPAAEFADSNKTRVGEFAIAIGAPFDLDYSVTYGHVSAKGRSRIIPDRSMDQDFIQTDANINPGNSGGPLVNINGEVMGINTLIRGLRSGIGFAIPSNLARGIADQIIAGGKVVRAWLGVSVESLTENPELRNVFPGVGRGLVVRTIEPEGPAAKSDLKPSDIILTVDGTPVNDALQLRSAVRARPVGQNLTLSVNRKGREIKVQVKSEAWPESEPAVAAAPTAPRSLERRLGITVQTMSRKLSEELGVKLATGVVITEVDRGSSAERRGLKAGDIITEVNQKPVKTVEDFRDALKDADLTKGAILNLISEGVSKFEVLKTNE